MDGSVNYLIQNGMQLEQMCIGVKIKPPRKTKRRRNKESILNQHGSGGYKRWNGEKRSIHLSKTAGLERVAKNHIDLFQDGAGSGYRQLARGRITLIQDGGGD
jgi:hypothetical protein